MRALIVWISFTVVTTALHADTPAPRWGHVFVYDQTRDEILLFGGASARSSYLDDTWTWKNGLWTRHDTPSPPHRGFSGAAFDPVHEVIIMHGGRGNERVTYSDSWLWNGKRWVQIEEDGSWQVDHHQVVWDGENQQLVGFGGWTGSAVLGETRIWNSETWIVASTSGPPPRSIIIPSSGMTYGESSFFLVARTIVTF